MYYETKKTALLNIRLIIVRKTANGAYCLAYDKQGRHKPEFNNYYIFSDLTKIK